MNNKKLEDRLLKHGTDYAEIIRLIEKCETGHVGEIRISKDEMITKSAILDKMIFTYLKKLKIKVVYAEDTEKEEDDGRPKCGHEIHKVISSNMKKSIKIKMLKKSNNAMIKIDLSSFVICPACSDIKEVQ